MLHFFRRKAVMGGCFGLVLAVAGGGWLLLASNARAINVDLFGVAIGGYDPVAYFTLGRAVQGTSAHEHRWSDAAWHFSSAEHRDLFVSDPTRYAPQYGGFCAAGLAMGGKWKADPEVWKIVDGKLFLNFNKDGQKELAADPAKTIEKANETWRATTPTG